MLTSGRGRLETPVVELQGFQTPQNTLSVYPTPVIAQRFKCAQRRVRHGDVSMVVVGGSSPSSRLRAIKGGTQKAASFESFAMLKYDSAHGR